VQCAPAGTSPSTKGVPLTLVAVLGQSFTALTDNDGNFKFSYLPPGDYTLGPASLFRFVDPSVATIHVVAGVALDLHDVPQQDLSKDANNCGACGVACASGACSAGVCQAASLCSPGFADCNHDPADGCEVNLGTDPLNCTACGNVCPRAGVNTTPACAGECTYRCTPGFKDCGDGYCIPLTMLCQTPVDARGTTPLLSRLARR
jgi:hypothetical protein